MRQAWPARDASTGGARIELQPRLGALLYATRQGRRDISIVVVLVTLWVLCVTAAVGISSGSSRAQSATPVLDRSTFLGGDGRLGDLASDVAVDARGDVYVVGSTQSSDFPVVDGLQRSNRGGFDVFVARFSPDGSLVFSTYLGGSGDDYGHAIALDAVGDVYLTGETQSLDFPAIAAVQDDTGGVTCTTQRELCGDAFVARIETDSGRLVFSTHLGGRGGDMGTDIAIDRSRENRVVITGASDSPDFPSLEPIQAEAAGGSDAFVAAIANEGVHLLFSSVLGGGGDDRATGLDLDGDAQLHVAGWTESTDFPTRDATQDRLAGEGDAFVSSLDLDGFELLRSTYYGGAGEDSAQAVAAPRGGPILVVGTTDSTDLPLLRALQDHPGGRKDAFLMALDGVSGSLDYGSYLGGSLDDEGLDLNVDAGGNVYVAGRSFSGDFPLLRALQDHHAGTDSPDAFVSYFERGLEGMLYSTLLGGRRVDAAEGLSVDAEGNAYIVGYTRSEDFPTRNAAQSVYGGGNFDAFIARIVGGGGQQATATLPAPTITPGPSPTAVPTSTACAGDAPVVDPLTSPTDRTSQIVTGTGRPLTDIGGSHSIRLCSDEAGCFYAKTREGLTWEAEVAVLPNRINRYTAFQSSRACSHVASTRMDRDGQLLDIEHRPLDRPSIYLPMSLR